MSKKLPQEVAKDIQQRVYILADKGDYLAMSKPDSSKFLNDLVSQYEVGGVIGKYMRSNQVRHYIKDSVLNGYSKKKTKDAKPSDPPAIVKRMYGLDCEETHRDYKLALFRVTTDGHRSEYVVVAEGTMLKWRLRSEEPSCLFRASRFPVKQRQYTFSCCYLHSISR